MQPCKCPRLQGMLGVSFWGQERWPSVLQELCCQVEKLQENSIREEESEVEWTFSEMNNLKSWIPSATAGHVIFSPGIKVSAASGDGEGWKSVIPDAKRKASAPLKGLQLPNRFTALRFWRGSQVCCLHSWWRVMTCMLHLLEVFKSTNLSKEASSSLSEPALC